MNPTILIEVRGGCVHEVTTDGDVNVFIMDHDCGEFFKHPPEVIPTEQLNKEIDTLK